MEPSHHLTQNAKPKLIDKGKIQQRVYSQCLVGCHIVSLQSANKDAPTRSLFKLSTCVELRLGLGLEIGIKLCKGDKIQEFIPASVPKMKSTVELQMYQNLHEQTWASSAESRT
jgi:hypothetical protein